MTAPSSSRAFIGVEAEQLPEAQIFSVHLDMMNAIQEH